MWSYVKVAGKFSEGGKSVVSDVFCDYLRFAVAIPPEAHGENLFGKPDVFTFALDARERGAGRGRCEGARVRARTMNSVSDVASPLFFSVSLPGT